MVVGSIPDEIIDIFNLPNPSSRTIAVGFAQPLTEISIRKSFCWVKRGRPARLTTSLPSEDQLS
jgi:hypothetical protein